MRKEGLKGSKIMAASVAGLLFWGTAEFLPAEAATHDKNKVTVSSVKIIGNQKMTEEEILNIVPELKKKQVNTKLLGRQIQQINDNGALYLKVAFQPEGQNAAQATLSVQERKSHSVLVGVNNTGSKLTGKWRYFTSYTDSNLSKQADTLSLGYAYAPKHLKNGAAAYRYLLPKLADNLLFTVKYIDLDLGSLLYKPTEYDFGLGNKSLDVGLHYQHNFAYTPRERDVLDVGIQYKKYEPSLFYDYYDYFNHSRKNGSVEGDYRVAILSVDYLHNIRTKKQTFTYDLGFATNLHGNTHDYVVNTLHDCDGSFHLWKADAIYQSLLPKGWISSFRVHGQYTPNVLVAPEKMGAGGMNIDLLNSFTERNREAWNILPHTGGLEMVRGFNDRAITADYGCIGSLEFYTPPIAKNSRLVLFADGAIMKNNANEAPLRNDKLASVGIGYRYTDVRHGIYLMVDYAHVLKDVDNTEGLGHKRWNAMLNMVF